MTTRHELVDVPELAPAIGFAHAVVAAPGRQVFLGGQTAQGLDGRIVGATMATQFEVAASNVQLALRAAGGEAEDLVSLMIYVTDVPQYRRSLRAIAPIYRRYFGRHYPAIALLGVAELFDEDAMIELVGTAVIPAKRQSAEESGS
ncbi:MAG TPA: RidA family protein [Pseudonocardiaceae bacterium]|nr:RidA family protein [Pseudonocardiaceae bacterium]